MPWDPPQEPAAETLNMGVFCEENLGVRLLAVPFLPNLGGCEQGAFKRILNQNENKRPRWYFPFEFPLD